jgi:DNA helicase-2/ATP-dependent DNA helicase PcrA
MGVPERIAKAVAEGVSGSVVAPAGYGKTETIADIVAGSSGRFLLLTHTLVGVDALKARLRKKGVRLDRVLLDTIAAWSLRYASSFPQTSGLAPIATPQGTEWEVVYKAAGKLVSSRALDAVITSSYAGVLVDEYQDCTKAQHEIIKGLARLLPVYVFGDPLQGIFDFGSEAIVDWSADVTPVFPLIDELQTPWRWETNHGLSQWLVGLRQSLASGAAIDLTRVPACIRVHHVTDAETAQKAERKACGAYTSSDTNRVAIIGAKGSEDQRAALAKRAYAQNVEAINCKALFKACADIEGSSGPARLSHIIKLMHRCMVGVRPTPFLRRMSEIHSGAKKPKALKPSEMAALRCMAEETLEPVLLLIEELRRDCRPFRSELLFALRESLKLRLQGHPCTLADAARDVQERRRHAGRRHGHKIVTSTLLVKGLEYESSVVFLAGSMKKEDVYVALTRASLRMQIVTDNLTFKAV